MSIKNRTFVVVILSLQYYSLTFLNFVTMKITQNYSKLLIFATVITFLFAQCKYEKNGVSSCCFTLSVAPSKPMCNDGGFVDYHFFDEAGKETVYSVTLNANGKPTNINLLAFCTKI